MLAFPGVRGGGVGHCGVLGLGKGLQPSSMVVLEEDLGSRGVVLLVVSILWLWSLGDIFLRRQLQLVNILVAGHASLVCVHGRCLCWGLNAT